MRLIISKFELIQISEKITQNLKLSIYLFIYLFGRNKLSYISQQFFNLPELKSRIFEEWTRGRCIETGVFKYLMYTSGYLMFSGMPRKQKRRQKVHTPENLNLKKINNSQHI